jgi:dCTP deaminase
MLLSDIDIAKALVAEKEDDRIVISPIISGKYQFGPSSIDVRLGTDFAILDNANLSHISTQKELNAYTRKIRLRPNEVFYLHPMEFALASTLEFIRIPNHLAARLEGRSSWGRLGLLVHATAGYIDPGYSGVITFELANAGKVPIGLSPGDRLGQICFFKMTNKAEVPYGSKTESKYQGATEVQASRIFRDPEKGSK